MTLTKTKSKEEELKKLLADKQYTQIPKVGETVKGTIISVSKNEIHLDINGIVTGVIRGRELYKESSEYSKLKPGDKVEATVLELENERGEMELSFRYAGHQKTWGRLAELKESGEIIKAKVIDANKGGLMVKTENVIGFLPVSQLNPEHYPRVQGGDKNKILEKLKQYTDQDFNVKVIDADEKEEKLIVSEKIAWEEEQGDVISKYKVGDVVEGTVTAVTDFGVFVTFGENLEGLIHISELAWQRIDDPKDFIKVGQKVKAEIINIQGSKIFLSIKKLKDDPWKDVEKKYKLGQVIEGKVIKINHFGLFVELDKDIHGLAHISELSDKAVTDTSKIAKEGDVLKFKIVSIEPSDHRLGLSLKALKESNSVKKSETEEADKKTTKEPKKEEKSQKKEKESDKSKKEVKKEKSTKEKKEK